MQEDDSGVRVGHHAELCDREQNNCRDNTEDRDIDGSARDLAVDRHGRCCSRLSNDLQPTIVAPDSISLFLCDIRQECHARDEREDLRRDQRGEKGDPDFALKKILSGKLHEKEESSEE